MTAELIIESGPANRVDKLPRGFHLFTGNDSYRDGDFIDYEKNELGEVVSWLKLSPGIHLVKNHVKIIKETLVWRKK